MQGIYKDLSLIHILKDYNCMAVVSSMTYNKEGVMFEFTQSRHRPDRFVFYDLAHRTK